MAILGVTVASFLFRSQIAATVLLAPYDDGLFLRLADAVGEGSWLGEYDQLTLAKGPAYPVFVALVGLLHLPLKLSEHAVYLAAAAGMALVVFRISHSATLAVVLYAVLALNPMMWGLGLARIIRDGFYVALSLGVVAISAWLFLASMGVGARGLIGGVALAIFAGAVIAAYWLTREEGVWLGPALGVLVIGSAGLVWTTTAGASSDGGAGGWRGAVSFVGMRLVLVAASASVVLTGVAAINADRYGVRLVNDLTEGSFPAAYGALARIEHDADDRYVPVPASARVEAYRVSPAAAELEPYLDGESGANWTAIGCGGPPDPSKGCDDIRGGWFMWAMRQAVELAGHWGSAPAAQAFLARLAEEVDAACGDGRLACGPRRDSLTPPLDLRTLADASGHVISGLVVMTGADPPVRTGVSATTAADAVRVALRVGPVAPLPATSPAQVRIRGWVAGTAGVPSIAVGSDGDRTDAPILFDPAPDVDAFLESQGEEAFTGRRFELITDCAVPECRLIVRGADGEEHRLRMAALATGPVLHSPSLWLFIDAVSPVRTSMEEVLDEGVVRGHPGILAVMHWLQGAFGFLVPLGLTFGVAGVGLTLMRTGPRSRSAPLLILATSCAVALASRLLIIAMIEVTSWPGAMNDIYLAPGSPFLLTFAVLGSYLGVMALSDLARRSHRDVLRASREPPSA